MGGSGTLWTDLTNEQRGEEEQKDIYMKGNDDQVGPYVTNPRCLSISFSLSSALLYKYTTNKKDFAPCQGDYSGVI